MDKNFIAVYTFCWISLLITALIVAFLRKEDIEFLGAEYWKFLFIPWKLLTFFIATASLVFVAPHTGDPTWDYIDAFFMSVFAFTTAPWSVGIIYRVFAGKSHKFKLFLMFCIWMFATSWSYDIYIYLRYGYYPDTWLINIPASGSLYGLAGLFWNLNWQKEKGPYFSFVEDEWLSRNDNKNQLKVILWGLPFMIFVALVIAYFVWNYLMFVN